MDNYKYVRIDNIYQRLAQRLKGRHLPFDDIVEWCAECELEEIGHYTSWFRYQDVELTLTDNQVVLPENCYYIKECKTSTRSGSAFVDFYVNGNYLTTRKNYSTVYIDYYAFPTDSDTGYPLIPRGHQDACFYYCLKSILMEEYLDGRIPENRWNRIVADYENAVARAVSKSNRTSKNQMVKVMQALHTTKFNVYSPYRRTNRSS